MRWSRRSSPRRGSAVLVGDRAPETPGTPPLAEFHQTSSLDVGIVLSGRIVLEMEDGTSAELSAGEAFAQLGTSHNWRNPYSVDAVIAVVMMGRDK